MKIVVSFEKKSNCRMSGKCHITSGYAQLIKIKEMKTKEINTGKATILLVNLPKGAKNPVLMGKDGMSLKRIYFELKGKESFVKFPKIGINSYALGFADQITEEQAMEVVEHSIFDSDYKCATDKLNSLLKANSVVTVNPHEKPVFKPKFVGDMPDKDYSYQKRLKQYEQAESKLWENLFVLVKVD